MIALFLISAVLLSFLRVLLLLLLLLFKVNKNWFEPVPCNIGGIGPNFGVVLLLPLVCEACDEEIGPCVGVCVVLLSFC